MSAEHQHIPHFQHQTQSTSAIQPSNRQPDSTDETTGMTNKQTPEFVKNVLGVPELLEKILLEMDPRDLLKHLRHDVAFGVRAQLNASVKLQRKLYLRQDPADPTKTEDDWEQTDWKPNRILFPEKDDQEGLTTFFSIGSSHYAIGARKFNHDVLEEETTSEHSADNYFVILFYTWPSQYGDELEPEMLDMYLTDKAEPFSIRMCQTHDEEEKGACHDDAELWVPAGKTLRDILHWVTAWKAGAIQKDDVFNGFYQWEPIYGDMMDWIRSGDYTEEEYQEEFETGPLVRHGTRKVPRAVRAALQEKEAQKKALVEAERKMEEAEEKLKQAEKKLKEKVEESGH